MTVAAGVGFTQRRRTTEVSDHLVDRGDFDRFIEVVRQIDDFFVTVVKLPGR
ncbi:hypothetical protein [Actinacidiphila sp. bgisy160]|uniref:hypothetical protein n=1 Tax=Actinacidiphila sp. bgisy160 TaxID=3413796 RepID=UPI003D764AB7